MIHTGYLPLSLLAAVCVFLSSCERVICEINDPHLCVSETKAQSKMEYDVTQEMAELFISSIDPKNQAVDVTPFVIEGLTCFYVFNFDDGFTVVSADTRIQPVLVECDHGHLYPEKNTNPGVKVWLEDTADIIKTLKTLDLNTKQDYSKLWAMYRAPKPVIGAKSRRVDVDSIWVRVYQTTIEDVYNSADVAPLLETKWGQHSPWNSKMPKIDRQPCLTGCVAVAVSQVLYFFNRRMNMPNDLWHNISIQNSLYSPIDGGLVLSLSRSNRFSPSSRWSQMALTKTDANTDYVSDLMLDVGERLDMHYKTSNSVVLLNYDYSIPNLNSCGISSSFGSYSFQDVKSSLLQDKPVIVTSTALLNQGHTWVIDGCHEYSRKYTTTLTYYCIHPEELILYPNNSGYISYDDMTSLYPDVSGKRYSITQSIRYDDQESVHMNWGWDGDGDTWYNMLDTTRWEVLISGETVNFANHRVIHYDISTDQMN